MHKGLINGLQKTIESYFMVLLVTVSGHAQQTIEKPIIHYVSENKKTLISRVKRRIMIKKTGNECTSN